MTEARKEQGRSLRHPFLRDTYLGQFICRAGISYNEMVAHLHADNISLFNPVCLLLRGYLWIYFPIAAASPLSNLLLARCHFILQ